MPRNALGTESSTKQTYLIVFSIFVVVGVLAIVSMYGFWRQSQSPSPNTRTSNNSSLQTQQTTPGINHDSPSLNERDSLQPLDSSQSPANTNKPPTATDSKHSDQHPSEVRSSQANEKAADQKGEKERHSDSIACIGGVCL